MTSTSSAVRRLVPSSLASQAVALQLAAIMTIVIVGSALAALDVRADAERSGRDRTRDVAVAVALAPSTADSIVAGTATRVLQPETVSLRKATGIAFITVMSPDGTRYTHTNPSVIGRTYLGSREQALRGDTYTEVYQGTLGKSLRTITPVRTADGTIVGMVAAGITLQTLTQSWYSQLPIIITIGVCAALLSVAATWATRRLLLRHTGGLAPSELRIMYEHHDGVLHALSEGVIVTENGHPVLINDEARRLLNIDEKLRSTASLPLFVTGGDDPTAPITDELYVTDDRVVVVNRSPVSRSSAVITIRDRTELQAAMGELATVTEFAEELRSHAHEYGNKLHTVVSLIERGRDEEAIALATGQLGSSQRVLDDTLDAIDDPVIGALLIAKASAAAERGIAMTLTEDSAYRGTTDIAVADIMTVLGNLIDNAFDACAESDPWVEITLRDNEYKTVIVVADSGPGMDSDEFERARMRGYSTKTGGDRAGRGLGLALVSQMVTRYGGTITAERTYGSVITVVLPHDGIHSGRTS